MIYKGGIVKRRRGRKGEWRKRIDKKSIKTRYQLLNDGKSGREMSANTSSEQEYEKISHRDEHECLG